MGGGRGESKGHKICYQPYTLKELSFKKNIEVKLTMQNFTSNICGNQNSIELEKIISFNDNLRTEFVLRSLLQCRNSVHCKQNMKFLRKVFKKHDSWFYVSL
jgi:hypothetical protein